MRNILKNIFIVWWIIPVLTSGQNTIINSGATIINTNNLITKGNFINDGTYTDTTGTFIFFR